MGVATGYGKLATEGTERENIQKKEGKTLAMRHTSAEDLPVYSSGAYMAPMTGLIFHPAATQEQKERT